MTTTNNPIPSTYETAQYYYYPHDFYTHINLPEALAAAQELARQGFFVVMEEWHEEFFDISAADALYENEEEGDEGDEEDYYDALDRIREYDNPEEVRVFYSPAAFHSREEWKTFMKNNEDYFQRSNNSMVYLQETYEGEPFDGYQSDRDDDHLNPWRSWHANVKVFYEPSEVSEGSLPSQNEQFKGKRYDFMTPDNRVFFYGIQADLFRKATAEEDKIMLANAASEILRSELRNAPHPAIEAIVKAFEDDPTLANAEKIFALRA